MEAGVKFPPVHVYRDRSGAWRANDGAHSKRPGLKLMQTSAAFAPSPWLDFEALLKVIKYGDSLL